MSVQVRRRRESASFLSSFTGAQGELIVDTTNNRVQVHDGATPGGFPAAKLADLVARTAVNDANYAALPTDRTVAFIALTAARTVTLPAASAFPTGTRLLVVDEGGAATASLTITVARAGADTVNGAASAAIVAGYGYLALESNGVAKWTVVDQPGGGATGSGAQGATGATGPQGPTGATGPAGPAGAQGAQGAAGPAGATGPAGASVTIKGSVSSSSALPSSGAALGDGYISNDTGHLWVYSNASAGGSVNGFLDVGLVRGPAGPQGATGAAGATGSAGQAGATGPAGPAGTVGSQGAAGATGAQGPAGQAGATGPQGPAGATGPTGPAGFGRTQVSDAAYAVQAGDRSVAYIALTAARTVTLPAASSYPAGAVLTVLDESGACSASNALTLAAAGSDTINGAATAVIATGYGYLALESNTANKWTVIDAPAPVTTVAGRAGAVALAVADVSGAAPLLSPALAGTPTAPNAAAGSNSSQIATTSFVAASFVTFAFAGQTYATASNATLTGTPTAPTQAPKNNSTRLATTAYADAAVAATQARTQVSDASYAALASDRTVAFIALTAARTVTLPAASTYPGGAVLTIVDESGACSPLAAITVAASGADLVNGAATAVLSMPYGYFALESNTANKWTLIDVGGVGMATTQQLTNRNAVINGNLAVNQRAVADGSSPLTLGSGQYGRDRWKAGSNGCTYSAAASGADTVATITAGSLVQVVEGANVAAAAMWLSWAGTASARVYQGSAASQTSPAYAAGTPATVGGAAVNVLAVTGLAPGGNLSVEFQNGKVGLVQLEAALPGAGPTTFERRQAAAELALCRNYFRFAEPGIGTWFAGGSSAAAQLQFNYADMRPGVAATVTLAATALTIADPGVANVSFSAVVMSANGIGPASATMNFGAGSGSQSGNPTQYHIALMVTSNSVSISKEL